MVVQKVIVKNKVSDRISEVEISFINIIFLPRLLGSFPFTEDLRVFQLSVLRIVAILFLHAYAFFSLDWILHMNLHLFLETFQNVLYAFTILSIFYTVWQREHLISFRQNILSGIPSGYSIVVPKWPQIVSILIIVVVNVLKSLSDLSIQGLMKNAISFVSMIVFNSLVSEFTVFVHFLHSGFSLLQSYLMADFTRDRLHVVSRMHEHLRSSVSHLNVAYSLQLLLVMFTGFYQSVAACYFVIVLPSLEKKLLHIGSCLIHLQLFIRIIFACHYTSQKVLELNMLLYEAIKSNPRTCVMARDLSVKRTVTFTAGGFFKLNMRILGKMIMSGVTYLIILTQLD